jgi:hypothetical protein
MRRRRRTRPLSTSGRFSSAETIVTGTISCDPVHVTSWGTVIFGEETTTGHVYEMIDPASITNATLDRVSGVASTDKIVRRDALGAVAFEGIGILPSGKHFYVSIQHNKSAHGVILDVTGWR